MSLADSYSSKIVVVNIGLSRERESDGSTVILFVVLFFL